MSESARSTGTPTVQIDFRLVPKANEHFVNEKQFVDYRNHREKFVRWLLIFGKNPEEIVASLRTVENFDLGTLNDLLSLIAYCPKRFLVFEVLNPWIGGVPVLLRGLLVFKDFAKAI